MPSRIEDHVSILEGPQLPPLRDVNIGQLLDEQRKRYPERTAVVSRWQGRRLTYQDLHSDCLKIAQNLLSHGVRPGDRVVVLAGNALEYAQLLFAVGGIGAIFAIINPTFTQEEILSAVEFLKPSAIFVADRIGYRKNNSLLKDLASHPAQPPLIVQLLSSERVSPNVLTWHEFLQIGSSDAGSALLSQHWARVDANDTLCIQFTSGTTGPKKAAMLSHRNLLNNAILVGDRLQYTADDVVCCCTPLFHCFALVCGFLSAIAYGGAVVLPSDVFLAGANLQALSEEKITVLHGVPAMFQALLDHPDAKKYAPDMCLRSGIIAGSSLTHTLISRLSVEFRLNLAYGYGMTEGSCIAFLTTPSEVSLLDDHSSVGTLMPHTSAKVVNDSLDALPLGSPGELLLSGYLVFQKYYKNPEKTSEALVEDIQGREWLRTGDLVTMDASGRCTIIGRVKDLIKRGGENIFPIDIEKSLEQHADISAAAVVGIPDATWGEVVVAFVKRNERTKPGVKIGSKELKLWLRKRIAPHKMPEHFFWIGEGAGTPDELPINHSGKIVKAELRAVASRLAHSRRTSES
ncbi:Putative acyl-CoA synthetase YngI [Cytospora mali]|uniref:Acyl-CoA synthetase YngI n=1 Tax=Cytospora mali TaxID=578113 RepID=A0A194V406_CYTMA|nr:Putative acyl-CoA synthetase YngI [Valsa mali var. pyri (nom. inval.)]